MSEKRKEGQISEGEFEEIAKQWDPFFQSFMKSVVSEVGATLISGIPEPSELPSTGTLYYRWTFQIFHPSLPRQVEHRVYFQLNRKRSFLTLYPNGFNEGLHFSSFHELESMKDDLILRIIGHRKHLRDEYGSRL